MSEKYIVPTVPVAAPGSEAAPITASTADLSALTPNITHTFGPTFETPIQLPVLPLEATPTLPEAIAPAPDPDPERVKAMAGEIGAISLGSLFLTPIDKVALGINSVRRAWSMSRIRTAGSRAHAIDDTLGSSQDTANASFEGRGLRPHPDTATSISHRRVLAARHTDMAPATNEQRNNQWNHALRRDRSQALTSEAITTLRNVYGRPMRDATGKVMEHPVLDPATGKQVYKRDYTPLVETVNDIGTSQYFSRIRNTRMIPKDKRAAINAGHRYNKLIGAAEGYMDDLDRAASGTDKTANRLKLNRSVNTRAVNRNRRKVTIRDQRDTKIRHRIASR